MEKSCRKEYKRKWYLQNKEKELQKVKKWQKENPEYRKSWLKENGSKPKVRFDKARSKCNGKNKKHKEWNITFKEYERIISRNCTYCDKDISKETGSGLDRIDNNKCYTVDNVVACCTVCNVGRSRNFTPEEWKVGIRAIIEFRKNKGQKC